MKIRAWLFCLIAIQALAQTPARKTLSYQDADLARVLQTIEQTFDIRYSYADSVVSGKAFALKPGSYTLADVHSEMETQCGLSVIRISDRYYALSHREPPAIQQLDDILVEAFLSKGIGKTSRCFTLSPRQIEELPGVTDVDLLFSLQQLPGVKSPNETASGLHIRGGTPDQNLIRWDGIRLYHPGHLFGMISGYDAAAVQKVDFYNKAADPKFGERVSGIIDIHTAQQMDSLAFSAGINGLNAGVLAKIPISGKIGAQISGRKSYTEWLQTPTFNALAEKVFQNTRFRKFDDDNQFGFQDYSATLFVQPSDNDKISLSGIAIDNHLDFSASADTIVSNQKMDIRNYGFSGSWQHRFGKLRQELLVHYSAYTFHYENNKRYPQGNYQWFVKKNRAVDSGVEANYAYAWRDDLSLTFGYQLSGNDFSHVFLNRFPGLEVELDQQHRMNVSHAGYTGVKWTPMDWIIFAGSRWSYINVLSQSSFEPRLSVQKRFDNHFTAQISYERRSQIIGQVRENAASDLSLENYVWVLAGDDDPMQTASQVTAGLTFKSKTFLLDADLYYKTLDGVTSRTFGFLHRYDAQVRRGEGFTKGFDVLLQKSAPSWRMWLTYTFQDSQNRYGGIENGNYFPISSDITHAVTVSYFKQWGNWSASVGWFWNTGKPYSTLDDDGQVNAFNSKRLPVYHRLNVSGSYTFRWNGMQSGKVGISVLNLYDRRSVISREFDRDAADVFDVATSGFVARDYHSLGFTPNFFLRLNF
ncbi:TonB-dependent receptor plug domain-containing protein [Flavobacterium longum]|uniref:TonB-dependent receptor plug domain-containing protein n=1 Tax=Flavobacterium longum TaxID=1299340 RepID=UPI0039E8A752